MADAVLNFDALLRAHGARARVSMLCNANDTFRFSRICWEELARAARITTVSRYMKTLMADVADPVDVIPNGLPADAYDEPDARARARFAELVRDRMPLAKVGRWDPDKRWLAAIEAVAGSKRQGQAAPHRVRRH